MLVVQKLLDATVLRRSESLRDCRATMAAPAKARSARPHINVASPIERCADR